jgi:GDP-mannose 6-dehydrogenase
LVGGIDEASLDVALSIYSVIEAPLNRVTIPEAEMIKYACNVFHALKITFANEIGNYAKSRGVDGHVVMDMVCQDKKLNLSPYYMKPGFAYGGSCLPKDLRAILYSAGQSHLRVPMLESLSDSNARQIQRGIELVVAKKKKKVSVLGFSFKAGTDDLRESPVVALIESLIGKGFDVKLYDRNVRLSQIIGANNSYVQSVIPHIARHLSDSLEEVLAHGETIVIGNNAAEFARALTTVADTDKFVVDLVRLRGLSAEWLAAMGERYEGICW